MLQISIQAIRVNSSFCATQFKLCINVYSNELCIIACHNFFMEKYIKKNFVATLISEQTGQYCKIKQFLLNLATFQFRFDLFVPHLGGKTLV